MELSPKQRNILHEMGIPLWQRRTDNQVIKLECDDVIESVDTDISFDSDLLLLLPDKPLDKKMRAILTAMLYAINRDLKDVNIVNSKQLPHIKSGVKSPTLLVVMGAECAAEIQHDKDKLLALNQIQYGYAKNLALLMTVGLDELLNTPIKKQIAWQTLVLIKQYLTKQEG